MKLFDLHFELRDQYKELPDLLRVFNKMVFTGQIYKSVIKVFNYHEHDDEVINYISIDMHRCKPSIASIGIRRDLRGSLSEPLQENLKILSEMQDKNASYFPFFETDDAGNTLTISIYNSIPKDIILSDSESLFDNIPMHSPKIEILNLNFYLRKDFPELQSLFVISNRMLQRQASSFITIKSSTDRKALYLNLNILFQDKLRPSLFFTVGLVKNSFPREYQIELAKFNFACSKIPNSCLVTLNCIKIPDFKHGPLVQIKLFESERPEVKEEIDYQFKLLNSISPN